MTPSQGQAMGDFCIVIRGLVILEATPSWSRQLVCLESDTLQGYTTVWWSSADPRNLMHRWGASSIWMHVKQGALTPDAMANVQLISVNESLGGGGGERF